MVLEKKSKSQIIKRIIESVSPAPKSIYELSKELDSNWDTIKGNVELLVELGILGIDKQKVFLKKDSPISIREDAVAGLPLSDAARKMIYALAKKINDIWMETTGKEPNKTQLQKAMIDVADKFPSLDIPRGWYFYGKIVLVKVDKAQFSKELDKYDFRSHSINLKEFDHEIKEIIKKISKLTIPQLMDYQYERYGKQDYIIKRNIEKLFLEKKFEKEKFANLLYQLIFNLKIIKDDPLNHKVISIIKEGISIMITQTFNKDIDQNLDIKMLLIEIFNTFWKLYATYGLLLSLEGDLGYNIRIINSVFEDRINFYANDLTDSFILFAASEV